MFVFENVSFEDVSFVAEPITSPKRRNPFYLVWRNSYNSENNFLSVSRFGGLDGYGTVVGGFKLPRSLQNDSVREILLSKADEIIMSEEVVSKEIPVFMNWEGAKVFPTQGMVFGRRV